MVLVLWDMTTRTLIVAVTMGLAGCGDAVRERDGNFSISETASFGPHTSTRASLRHGRKKLTSSLMSWSVDPRNPDRIVFEAVEPCGAWYYDGQAKSLRRVGGRNDYVEPRADLRSGHKPDSIEVAQRAAKWSPDGIHFWLTGLSLAVVDGRTGSRVRIDTALSTRDGGQVGIMPLSWSPSGYRLAMVVTAGSVDQDLVEISLSPFEARYVATIADSNPAAWGTGEGFQWVDERLRVATRRNVVERPASARGWRFAPPSKPGPAIPEPCDEAP